MAHINLLPWRAARRKQREREFYGQLGVAFVVGILAVIVLAVWMGQRIDNQQDRNAYLKDQIHQLDAKISKIKDLQKVRSELLTRKQIIEQLQSSRSQMVHLFDALVKTIPSSVRLTSLKQNQSHLSLDGVAQSNASVADYMRRLAKSPWLGAPDLQKTVNSHDGSRTPYSFGLGINLNKPAEAQREAAKQAQAKPASASSTAAVAATKPAAAKPADASGKKAANDHATARDKASAGKGRAKA
ncbi:MAG TPA: PilN domain-containing protein [Rhodanobacteraceae bacterium]